MRYSQRYFGVVFEKFFTLKKLLHVTRKQRRKNKNYRIKIQVWFFSNDGAWRCTCTKKIVIIQAMHGAAKKC